ncbi:MAG: hypothetical protein NTX45_02010 [Proteobacteria bacterium]|nr:hypothetical protein [Pseudomonadota bacterium]
MSSDLAGVSQSFHAGACFNEDFSDHGSPRVLTALITKVSGFIYPMNFRAKPRITCLQLQSPGVKLQGLHKKALYVRFNRLHDQHGSIPQQGFQFV